MGTRTPPPATPPPGPPRDTGPSAGPSAGASAGPSAAGTPLSGTERTRVRRLPERARRDRAALYELLDTGLVCHLGVVADGSPRVIPTGYGRSGDTLYLHGSSGARSLLTAAAGAEICVTVTRLDGIVLARSVFHHSMNYQSAMIYGVARHVTGTDEKLAGLRTLTEHLAPGQWDAVRPPNRKELAATTLLALPLTEASVKMRQGPPGDDEADMDGGMWAGVLPVGQFFGEPVPDAALPTDIPVPDHVRARVTRS